MSNSFKIKLREAFLELNNTCNFSCVFCPYPNMKRAKTIMKRSEAIDLIDQIKDEFEIDHLSLHLYGEPLLHPDILNISEYAESKGVNVNLTTNGVYLTGEKLLNFLNQNIWRIILSVQHTADKFYSRNPSTNLTGEEYYFQIEETVKSFIHYKTMHQNCRTTLEIHYLTTDDIKPNISLAESDKDAKMIIDFWKDNLTELISHFSLNKMIDNETGYKIQLSKDCFLRFKPAITFGNVVGSTNENECKTGYCFFPSSTLVILSNGDLVPCCIDYEGEMVLGNAFTSGGVRKVWESEKAKKIRTNFEKEIVSEKRCRQCLGGSHFGNPI